MTRPRFAAYRSMVLVVCGLILASCAHDTYQERANMIKNHADAFYDNLKANRVESAIRENEQIEAMASQMGDTVRKRAGQQGTAAGRARICLDEYRQRSRGHKLARAGTILHHQASIPPSPFHLSTRDRHLHESHRPTIP